MTPKAKAKELFDKYCLAIKTKETEDVYFTNIIHAKICALIAVNELITQELFWLEEVGGEMSESKWVKIKEELEKL